MIFAALTYKQKIVDHELFIFVHHITADFNKIQYLDIVAPTVEKNQKKLMIYKTAVALSIIAVTIYIVIAEYALFFKSGADLRDHDKTFPDSLVLLPVFA